MESILKGHSSSIWSIAITSDDSYIYSGSSDNSIGVWNFKLRTLEGWLKGHTGTVYGLAISSDDLYIVSASGDKTIRMWNIKNKIQESILVGHDEICIYCSHNT